MNEYQGSEVTAPSLTGKVGRESAIIVAGGKGLRMGADLPKQFLPIGGRPVLMHTLEVFERAIPGIQLVLVLPADQQDFWRDLCHQHSFTLPHIIATGGKTRFHSVRNGLLAMDSSSYSLGSVSEDWKFEYNRENLVAVHDGVRPFVSVDVIRRCFDAAREHGAAVPVVPVVETVRQLSPPSQKGGGGGSFTVDRSLFRLVQTPQVFWFSLFSLAYCQRYSDSFTDDASVIESFGHPITLVEGNRENIKITTPFDLTIAEALLARH